MKRLYFCIAIFLIMAAIVGLGTYKIYYSGNVMNDYFNQIEAAVNKGDKNEAVSLAKKAEKDWIEFEKELTVFVNHSEINEIGISVSAMIPYIQHEEKAEFFSELNKARVQLIHLALMENIDVG